MAKQRSFSTSALVIKRINIGEADRIITLLSKDQGKLVAVAKGVRKLSSAKKSFLEPGDIVEGFFVTTKSLPLLTQARLISSAKDLRTSLPKIRQLSQLLEIVDALVVEGEDDPAIYSKVLSIRKGLLLRHSHATLSNKIGDLVVLLGYPHPKDSNFSSILEYVASLSEKSMRSFEYLKVS